MHKRGESSILGQKLGPYFVKDRIGQGGMGAVYLAVDTALDRKVALKTLLPRHADDAEFVARFQREARASAKLSHPNIVQIYTVDIESDPAYMAMEYVDGESLESRIRRTGPLKWQHALTVVSQVAAALACAHAAGIVHRDIKPANILIDNQGRARVTDFGIAKVLDDLRAFHAKGELPHAQTIALQRAAQQPATASAANLTRSPTGPSPALRTSLVDDLIDDLPPRVVPVRAGAPVEVPWMGILVTSVIVLIAALGMVYLKGLKQARPRNAIQNPGAAIPAEAPPAMVPPVPPPQPGDPGFGPVGGPRHDPRLRPGSVRDGLPPREVLGPDGRPRPREAIPLRRDSRPIP